MTSRLAVLSGYEYFWQREAKTCCASKAPCGPASVSREDQQGGFSLHGHQLSSLYRIPSMGALTLMRGYRIRALGFFLPKILKSPPHKLRSARP